MAKYRKQRSQASASRVVSSSLRELILHHLEEWIPKLVDEEIDEYLGRGRYEPLAEGQARQYRNGYHKERSLTTGSGTVRLRLRRLRQPFQSQIVQRYQRTTDDVHALLPELYMHGLATGDFRDALGLLLGDQAPLSPASIVRAKAEWEESYKQWRQRKLEAEYLYVWADGVYPKAGPVDEHMAVLTLVGLNRKGRKEVLAVAEGYRESFQSWRDLLHELKRRGLEWIGLLISDGVPALAKALREVYPLAKRQRCLVHKMANILDKVPDKAHDEVLQALREIYHARNREEARARCRAFRGRYGRLYPQAVRSLQEAGEQLFSYFDFPRQHWKSIKSTNVIESLFNAVKLRTDAARRIPSRTSALYLVYKLLHRQEHRLHKIAAYKLVPATIDQLRQRQRTRERKAA
ncbi:MAG: IS256 family transposase [Bacteroidota bacterium]